MSLIDWIYNRRVREKASLRQRGYDYAAGHLLAGKSPEQIEAEAYDQWHQNEFNFGMQSAILAWDRRNYELVNAPKRTPFVHDEALLNTLTEEWLGRTTPDRDRMWDGLNPDLAKDIAKTYCMQMLRRQST